MSGTLQRRGKVHRGLCIERAARRFARRSRRSPRSYEGRALITAALLEEVTALVEWPVAIAGQFEARFLSLPREVLIATLQHASALFRAREQPPANLLPRFITISNIDSPMPRAHPCRQRARGAPAPGRCRVLLAAGSTG
jgi:glycyl-tRNA synthetase beta chain